MSFHRICCCSKCPDTLQVTLSDFVNDGCVGACYNGTLHPELSDGKSWDFTASSITEGTYDLVKVREMVLKELPGEDPLICYGDDVMCLYKSEIVGSHTWRRWSSPDCQGSPESGATLALAIRVYIHKKTGKLRHASIAANSTQTALSSDFVAFMWDGETNVGSSISNELSCAVQSWCDGSLALPSQSSGTLLVERG